MGLGAKRVRIKAGGNVSRSRREMIPRQLHFARYGIWDLDKAVTIIASYDCLLDTLDPAECHNAAWSVAFAADQFEHKHGEDTF